MNLFTDIDNCLHRNGILIERARLERRSLTSVERNIVQAGRNAAQKNGMTRQFINALEMEGERNSNLVREKVKVVAKFAYYHDPYEDIPAVASYLVIESNHPSLPKDGNVGANQLAELGFKVPDSPNYEKWVKNGRMCFRGSK